MISFKDFSVLKLYICNIIECKLAVIPKSRLSVVEECDMEMNLGTYLDANVATNAEVLRNVGNGAGWLDGNALLACGRDRQGKERMHRCPKDEPRIK